MKNMTILSKLHIPFNSISSKEILLPKSRHKNGRITVLLGENGTRKSLMLRNILDSCFINNEIHQSEMFKKNPDSLTEFHNRPLQVIAISATPTDRFPAKSSPNERLSKYDWNDYYYLGPRTGRNLISRNHSVHELAVAILRNPDRVAKKSSFITKIMKKCELPTQITFELDLSAKFESYRRKSENNPTALGFFDYALKYDSKQKSQVKKNIEILEKLIRKIKIKDIKFGYGSLGQFSFRLDVDFNTGSIDTPEIQTEELFEGLSSGILKVRTLKFINEISNIHCASSGQWNLFSSLVSLSLIIDDNTLVLIDEPENTLHPLWQSEYLPEIFSCLSGTKGCEIVVATHSPLLASSLKRGRDIIVRLSKIDGVVTPELIDTPEGWSANDILEDTFELPSSRSAEIVKIMEKALSLIAKGIKNNQVELNRLHIPLIRYQSILPENDPLLSVISSILTATSIAPNKNDR